METTEKISGADVIEIMNNLPGMVVKGTINPLRFTFVSNGCEGLTGYTSAEIVNGVISPFALSHPDDAEMMQKLLETTLAVGEPMEATFRIVAKDGTEKRVWMRSRCTDTCQEGMPCTFEGFCTDITKQLNKETAKLANSASSEFLTKMNHELRIPMNSIIGMAELSLMEGTADKIREYTHMITKAGKNLMSVLNDMLYYTEIDGGTLEIVSEDYTLSSLLTEVVNIVKTQTADALLDFSVYIDSNLPNELHGDVLRLRRILASIMSNAVKFTDDGFVALSVEGEVNGDILNLAITAEDTGRGVKPDDQPALFDKFVQVDTETIEGSGLGLYIAENLARLMGGEIHVSSMYGVGSIFTVTLPQTIRSHEKICEITNPEDKRVLFLEQRESRVDAIALTMDNLGVNYDITPTVDEFFNAVSSGRYTNIFAADESLGEFKKKYPDFESDVKIMLITEPFYCLPVADILNGVEREDNDQPPVAGDYARVSAPNARVLIVDDISSNLIVAKGLLRPYEMELNLVESGTAAIEAVKSNRYDLIFMDHMMPVMNGVEATLCIREMALLDCETDCKNVPIVALTANASYGAWQMFRQNGFDDFLAKPIDTIKLNAIIEKWVPKDKQKEIPRAAAATAEANFEIEGIDVKKGLTLTGGNVDIYLQAAEAYYKNGTRLLAELNDCLENNNIELFTIHVHALKSASASIGADGVSELAAQLEKAGEQKDAGFIRANTANFLTQLRTLLNNIAPVLEKEGGGNAANMRVIKTALVTMKNALLDGNVAAINEISIDLQKYIVIEDIGDVINKILLNKMLGKHDEAIKLIDTIL